MKNNFVTIEREYGSGGTMIARKFSEMCGVKCYGHEILELVSKNVNMSIDNIEKYEESVTNSFLYSLVMLTKVRAGESDMLSGDGHVYVAEQEAIRKLATEGRSVFLGHCASEALKDRKGVINVYIRCSDLEEKRKRIIQEYGIAEKNALQVMKNFDKKRANYYYANTSKKWDDFKNYDIVLDTAKLGIDGCVNLLMGLF